MKKNAEALVIGSGLAGAAAALTLADAGRDVALVRCGLRWLGEGRLESAKLVGRHDPGGNQAFS